MKTLPLALLAATTGLAATLQDFSAAHLDARAWTQPVALALASRSPQRPAKLRGAAACPGLEGLKRPWLEEAGGLPSPRAERHLAAGLDALEIQLIPVNGESWWVGGSRRGRGSREPAEPGCFALGSAAFYVYGREDEPEVDFERTVRSGGERSLSARLIELRWYDEATGRKRRWFDARLAARLGWDRDGRGAPTEAPRPIPLPQTPNELF